jgi:cobaltochelatase CobN
MHLLAATPGGINDGSEAVDLEQQPGDIVFLSAADSELSSLAIFNQTTNSDLSLRLANNMQLSHNLSVDIYVEDVISNAKLVIIRLLGGISYWSYGVERITECCRRNNILLTVLPGDDQPDEELAALNTVSREQAHRLWQYLVQGGRGNYINFLKYSRFLLDAKTEWQEPKLLMKAGLYWPDAGEISLDQLKKSWRQEAPIIGIMFYRALYQAGNLAPVDDLIDALRRKGLNSLPIYVASLKDTLCAEVVAQILAEVPPSVILNATGFALSNPGATRKETPFDAADCPILQVIFAGGNEEDWRAGVTGLSARDIAMNVCLPEVDGRIMTRAVSFKADAGYDKETQTNIVNYKSVKDRIQFVADLAESWTELRNTSVSSRKIAVVLANYPNKNGRIGNGVGLDTPAGTIEVLKAMQANGYTVDTIPETGNALIESLLEGPTNSHNPNQPRENGIKFSVTNYQRFFSALPKKLKMEVLDRWGAPETDPFVVNGNFLLSIKRYGNVFVGIQPARGYNIDPTASYHDPDLVPPHGYFAFYAWLREKERINAIIHMGKHGNMEWLPGKAVALSEECYPEAVFGPTVHLYPFIVNDPGEGTQAKRRASAVIIDHLTPPMTRAESYGPLADLERLVDEYYEAAGVDPRRIALLRQQILELTQTTGIDIDCGIGADLPENDKLAKLDNYLCELKELQIRDGLHIFGKSPTSQQLTDLLVALVRIPRGDGIGQNASLIRALSLDLGFSEDFDPLDCDMAGEWKGERPDFLQTDSIWRSNGDTVEKLEELAAALVSRRQTALVKWKATSKILSNIENSLRPAVEECGTSELAGLLKGLDGRFVEPGPSGAPTRGRNDVIPTGRNFYSVDSRAIPTPTAWLLGWKSAGMLIDRYRQENGAWPKTMILSAWGTANMRTGGDDIAQALALMGVRPTWDKASSRVTGFEILPASILDRPRVDVTLRISGFFRDAFPQQMALFDSAVRDVAALDEEEKTNPLATKVRLDQAELEKSGLPSDVARKRAAYRLFGSKPGAYGAGLQALMDEKGWTDEQDLARAYVAWGGYAYGAGAEGVAEHGLFERRLGQVEAVVHNQDNREHDLLDSDDYYQFEGGVTAAIRHIKGSQPTVYHNDHSRPESPKIRTLEEEIGRVVRARAINPKWIEGVMRHGYKGAFEMAATVDYLFAFAATAKAVKDHHFDAVFDAYLMDGKVRQFLKVNNPDALQEMVDKFQEALDRKMWQPRRNTIHNELKSLKQEETT